MNAIKKKVLELTSEASAAACKAADEDNGPPESFTGWRTLHCLLCGHPMPIRIEVHAIRACPGAPARVYGVEIQLRDWSVGAECGVGASGAPGSWDYATQQAILFCLRACARDLGQVSAWVAIEEAWKLTQSTPAPSGSSDSRGKRL